MSSVITSTETCSKKQEEKTNSKKYEIKLVWHQVLYFTFFHVTGLYGIYLCFTSASWKTMLFAFVLGRLTLSLGITANHRLWCHRSFKAKLPLKIFMCLCSFTLGQEDILLWCRDHRIHHKFVDTDADPYNIKRGFFYSHIGWLLCHYHPAYLEAVKKVPMDDLLADPVVRFNKKYYYPLFVLFSIIIPSIIPVYFWSERWLDAFCVAGCLRYILQCHGTFCINSVAHTFGYRPFDKKVEARETYFGELAQPGEGSHNYHHAFPADYTTREIPLSFNSSRFFIDFMAYIGQAYDVKLSSREMIKARRLKSGDGSS